MILATKAEEFKSITAYKFDAVWAMALTLHNASKKFDLTQFNYKSYRIRKEFQDLMQQTHFEGVTVSGLVRIITYSTGDCMR